MVRTHTLLANGVTGERFPSRERARLPGGQKSADHPATRGGNKEAPARKQGAGRKVMACIGGRANTADSSARSIRQKNRRRALLSRRRFLVRATLPKQTSSASRNNMNRAAKKGTNKRSARARLRKQIRCGGERERCAISRGGAGHDAVETGRAASAFGEDLQLARLRGLCSLRRHPAPTNHPARSSLLVQCAVSTAVAHRALAFAAR